MPTDPEIYEGLNALMRPSVPGRDGDQRSVLQQYFDAYDQPEPPAPILRYGNNVLLQDFGDLGGMALDALDAFGAAMAGMGPIGAGVAQLPGGVSRAARAATAANETRLEELGQLTSRTRNALSAFNPRQADIPLPVPPASQFSGDRVRAAEESLSDLNALLDRMPEINAARLEQYKAQINGLGNTPMLPARQQPMSYSDLYRTEAYKPQSNVGNPGARTAVRRAADPATNPVERGAREAAEKYEFRRGADAKLSRDVDLGRQGAIDGELHDIVGQVAATDPASIPSALARYADQTGRDYQEIVSSMRRLGYDINRIAHHVYQTRPMGGRFGPLEPDAKKFLDAVRSARPSRPRR